MSAEAKIVGEQNRKLNQRCEGLVELSKQATDARRGGLRLFVMKNKKIHNNKLELQSIC